MTQTSKDILRDPMVQAFIGRNLLGFEPERIEIVRGFTEGASRIWWSANQIACNHIHDFVDPTSLLQALVEDRSNIGRAVFDAFPGLLEKFLGDLESARIHADPPMEFRKVGPTPTCKAVLEQAFEIAKAAKTDKVAGEHLLRAVLEYSNLHQYVPAFQAVGVTPLQVRDELLRLFGQPTADDKKLMVKALELMKAHVDADGSIRATLDLGSGPVHVHAPAELFAAFTIVFQDKGGIDLNPQATDGDTSTFLRLLKFLVKQ